MEIRRFTSDLAETWDAFVRESRNGTVFHTRKFLSYHPVDRFEDHSLLIYDGEKLRAVVSAAHNDSTLISHPGATYGGLVLSKKTSAIATYHIIKSIIEYGKQQNFSRLDFLRLTPAPLRRSFSDDQEYALCQLGFERTRFELGSCIDLHMLTPENFLESFDQKCRNQVRQAERAGVEVRLSKDYDAYWPILIEALGGRHGVQPTHTLKEMKELQELFPNDIRLYVAEKNGILIAGVVTIALTNESTYVKYIAQDFKYQSDRPLNLAVSVAIHNAIELEHTAFNLGVAMTDDCIGINEGIFVFKEGFGARAMRRESYSFSL